MAKITIEELSGSLKEYLNGLGLTEAQVQELIDKFEDEKIGDISQLSTEEKGSLVGAINELFQSANNGKQIIADAIGSPLTEGDTFAAMGNSINGLTTNFRNALALKGVNAPGDKFETLIRRIEEIVQSGNVLNNQVMVSGEYVAPENYIPRGGYDKTITIDLNLDFDPEYFFIYFSNLGNKEDSNLNGYSWTESVILSTDCPEVLLHAAYLPSGYGGSDTRFRLSYDRTTANVTLIYGSYGSNAYVKQGDIIRWYAIGSSHLPNNGGERTITPSTSDQVLPDGYYSGDITVKGDSDLKPENILEGVEIFGVTGSATDSNSLRDSLASILEDEGVEVTEEDDMASLITKVDEEFTKDNDTISAKDTEINNLVASETTNKTNLATVLTNKGVNASSDETMSSLITKVDSIQSFKINAGTSVTLYSWNGDNTSVKTIGTGSATVTHDSLKWKSSWDGTFSILYIPNIMNYSGYGMSATFYYKILDASGNAILTSDNYTGNDGANVINNVSVTLQKDQSVQVYISATAGDNGCKIYGGQFYVKCSIDLGGTTI